MKRIPALVAVLLIAASAFGLDWGGSVDNTTGYASPPPPGNAADGFIQRTQAALWLRTSLGSWTFDTQGSYTYTPDLPLLFDLDRMTLGTDVIATAAGATTFGFSLGRSTYADPTGYVLRHQLDGLRLQVNRASSVFRLGVGTTALVQKPVNQIILSRRDVQDLADSTKVFAPPRLITTADYRFLEAIGTQHLTVAVTIQDDLRPQAELTQPRTEAATPDPNAGGQVDTQYVTLGINGPIAPGVFHTTYYTLNSGRQLAFTESDVAGTGFWYVYQPILAHMAGFELTWFLPQALNSRARLFTQFSTGESDRTSWQDEFRPLTPTTFSDVFTLQPGNSAHLGISYSLRPLAGLGVDVLQTEIRGVTYFRSTGSGAVSEPSVDPTSSGSYVGTDLNLILTAVPLSDLRFVLKGGAFLPNAAVMSPEPENQNVDYQVTLQAVLRF